MPFAEAVRRCSGSGGGGGGGDGGGDGGDGGGDFGPILEPLLNAGERYYLRSVGGDARKEAADFPRTFPDLARECNLLPPRPDKEGDGAGGEGDGEGGRTVVVAEAARRPLLDPSTYHSSVLRLASVEAEKKRKRRVRAFLYSDSRSRGGLRCTRPCSAAFTAFGGSRAPRIHAVLRVLCTRPFSRPEVGVFST